MLFRSVSQSRYPQDTIVSPGVFTRELDLSGITKGVADIGAAIVAPFPKGPGFTPTLVTSVYDLETKFGVADGVYYGPYTAKEYLNEKGFVTVVRVGALTGYNQNYPLAIYAEKGTWQRNQSKGALVSGSSFINYSGDWTPTGSIGISFTSGSSDPISGSSATYLGYTPTFGSSFSSSVVSSSNLTLLQNAPVNWAAGYSVPAATTNLWYTGSTSGSLTFSSSLTWTFQSEAADDDALSATSTSGSKLFAGQSYNSAATLSTTILRDPITFFSASYTISYPSSTVTASTFTYYSASVPDLSSASDGVFKIFIGLQAAPTTTIDTANNTYAMGTLQTYLNSDGLISNSSSVAITANSTIGVSIVANSISISTPLGTGSGGLGVSTYTSNAVIYSANTSAVAFATGSEGDVLQLTLGVPTFGKLDGGTF